MREIRSSGSAEGVMRNHGPYSDCFVLWRVKGRLNNPRGARKSKKSRASANITWSLVFERSFQRARDDQKREIRALGS
jgi:hypothetical protein